MDPKQLKNVIPVVARGVTPSGVHNATHMRVISLDIHIEDIGVGSCEVEYELGTVVLGDWQTLQVENPNHLATYELDADVFNLLANTPVSPHEKSMTPYEIIRDRIYGFMKALNMIE